MRAGEKNDKDREVVNKTKISLKKRTSMLALRLNKVSLWRHQNSTELLNTAYSGYGAQSRYLSLS